VVIIVISEECAARRCDMCDGWALTKDQWEHMLRSRCHSSEDGPPCGCDCHYSQLSMPQQEFDF
jgi:hypothetical protein